MSVNPNMREGSDSGDRPVEKGGQTPARMATENQVGGKEMQALRSAGAGREPHNLPEFQIAGLKLEGLGGGQQGGTKSRESAGLTHLEKPGGGFTDTRSDGKGSTTVHDQDANGSYKETNTVGDSKSTFEHTVGKNGSYTERSTDADGKVITKTHDPDGKGGFKELTTQPDGSTVDKRQDAKGSYTEMSQDKDGNFQSLTTHTLKPNGGFIDRTSTPDGEFKHDQNANGEFTETTVDANKNLTSPPFEVRGHPSDAFVQKTRNEIAQVPAADRKLLADNGYKYVVGESVAQAQPELTGKPTGTGKDGSWAKSTVGVNYGKEITVGEKVDGKDVSDKSNRTLLHETGHAIDAVLGAQQDKQNQTRLSESKEGQEAYEKDFKQLNWQEKKTQFGYETQMTHFAKTPLSAKREAFAEAYAAIRDQSGTNPYTKPTLDRWPNVTAYMREHMQELDH